MQRHATRRFSTARLRSMARILPTQRVERAPGRMERRRRPFGRRTLRDRVLAPHLRSHCRHSSTKKPGTRMFSAGSSTPPASRGCTASSATACSAFCATEPGSTARSACWSRPSRSLVSTTARCTPRPRHRCCANCARRSCATRRSTSAFRASGWPCCGVRCRQCSRPHGAPRTPYSSQRPPRSA